LINKAMRLFLFKRESVVKTGEAVVIGSSQISHGVSLLFPDAVRACSGARRLLRLEGSHGAGVDTRKARVAGELRWLFFAKVADDRIEASSREGRKGGVPLPPVFKDAPAAKDTPAGVAVEHWMPHVLARPLIEVIHAL
jgi:hypothetical protein